MGRFSGKIMLVTGATSGIGRAVALRGAKEGATVIAVGRNELRLSKIKKEKRYSKNATSAIKRR